MAESLLSYDDALCSSQDRKFLRTDATEMPVAHRGIYPQKRLPFYRVRKCPDNRRPDGLEDKKIHGTAVLKISRLYRESF